MIGDDPQLRPGVLACQPKDMLTCLPRDIGKTCSVLGSERANMKKERQALPAAVDLLAVAGGEVLRVL